MLKCWEADVDSRICFKEIIAELIREANETYATESSANKDYVTIMSCDVAELAKEPSEDHATESCANKDYMTVMPSHDINS